MMSDHPSPREGELRPESRTVPGFEQFNVCNSYSQSSSLTCSGGAESCRVSRRRLEEISVKLSDRDKEMIAAIQQYRYLLTGQVERLFFADSATKTAGLRATSRCLKRLRELGLMTILPGVLAAYGPVPVGWYGISPTREKGCFA